MIYVLLLLHVLGTLLCLRLVDVAEDNDEFGWLLFGLFGCVGNAVMVLNYFIAMFP